MFMEMKKQKFKNLYALMKADLHHGAKRQIEFILLGHGCFSL